MQDIRTGLCPLCEHDEIVESIPADFGDQNAEYVAAITYDPRWVMGGRNPRYPYGALRAYTCRSCGFTQLFADSPASIPIDAEHRTRLIKGPAQRLFR